MLMIAKAIHGAVKSLPCLLVKILGGVNGYFCFPKVSHRANTVRITNPMTKDATTCTLVEGYIETQTIPNNTGSDPAINKTMPR